MRFLLLQSSRVATLIVALLPLIASADPVTVTLTICIDNSQLGILKIQKGDEIGFSDQSFKIENVDFKAGPGWQEFQDVLLQSLIAFQAYIHIPPLREILEGRPSPPEHVMKEREVRKQIEYFLSILHELYLSHTHLDFGSDAGIFAFRKSVSEVGQSLESGIMKALPASIEVPRRFFSIPFGTATVPVGRHGIILDLVSAKLDKFISKSVKKNKIVQTEATLLRQMNDVDRMYVLSLLQISAKLLKDHATEGWEGARMDGGKSKSVLTSFFGFRRYVADFIDTKVLPLPDDQRRNLKDSGRLYDQETVTTLVRPSRLAVLDWVLKLTPASVML